MEKINKEIIMENNSFGFILNIPKKSNGYTRISVSNEINNCYEIGGHFQEELTIEEKTLAVSKAANYIEYINPNYQTIYIRTSDQEMKDIALLSGFTFDQDENLKAIEERYDGNIYTIHNKEYGKAPTQKVL